MHKHTEKKFRSLVRKMIMEEMGVSDDRITRAVADADLAFWGVIADNFPEITTGDFPPDATYQFTLAQEKAVRLWLKVNAPGDI